MDLKKLGNIELSNRIVNKLDGDSIDSILEKFSQPIF